MKWLGLILIVVGCSGSSKSTNDSKNHCGTKLGNSLTWIVDSNADQKCIDITTALNQNASTLDDAISGPDCEQSGGKINENTCEAHFKGTCSGVSIDMICDSKPDNTADCVADIQINDLDCKIGVDIR